MHDVMHDGITHQIAFDAFISYHVDGVSYIAAKVDGFAHGRPTTAEHHGNELFTGAIGHDAGNIVARPFGKTCFGAYAHHIIAHIAGRVDFIEAMIG